MLKPLSPLSPNEALAKLGFFIFTEPGELPEWPNGAVSKTVIPAMVSRVRIPDSPLSPFIAFSEEGFTKKFVMHYVYILKCADNSYYTGCTESIELRIERHMRGYLVATKSKLPIELVFYFAFADKYKAFVFERYLKSGSICF